MIANNPIDPATGLPLDKSYFECGLPPFLQESLDAMKEICRRASI